MKKRFLILFVLFSSFLFGQRGISMSKPIEGRQETNRLDKNISTPNVEKIEIKDNQPKKKLSSSEEAELNELMNEVNDENNIFSSDLSKPYVNEIKKEVNPQNTLNKFTTNDKKSNSNVSKPTSENNTVSTEVKLSTPKKIKIVYEEDSPVNSMSLFGKNFSELNEIEKIQLKGKQIEHEKQKNEKIKKLLQERQYWARKKLEDNKENPTLIIEDEYQEINENLLLISNKKELQEKLIKSINKTSAELNSNEEVELSSVKGLNTEQLSKKQIEIIERQNLLLKKELVGLLNPAEYQQSPKLLQELKKNNAELRLLFPVKGLDKIGDATLYKKLSDLISYNNNLKTKLTELLNDNFNQQVMEEFFKSSNILINFVSN